MTRSWPQLVALAVIVLGIVAIGCTGGTVPAVTPGQSGAPTPIRTSPPSTSTPSPRATVTATAAPSATATAFPESDAVELFMSNFAAAKPPFHVESEITVGTTVGRSGGTITLIIGGDVSGEDFAGTSQTFLPSGTVEQEIAIVGGRAYVRMAGGTWLENEQFQQTQPLNPFALLAPADLTYAGPVVIEARRLHRLQTRKWIGGDVDSTELDNAVLGESLFEILVDDEGLPVSATLTFDLSGTYQGQPAFIDYAVDYEFSAIGEPVTIEAPIP